MPVSTKENLQSISDYLSERYIKLRELLRYRDLLTSSEGVVGRGSWVNPEKRAATIGNEMELRMAVEDFKTILSEIKRL